MEKFPLWPARLATHYMPQNAQFSWSLATFNILPIISPQCLQPNLWLVKCPRLPSTPVASIKTISDSGDFIPSVGQFNSQSFGNNLTQACNCIKHH